MTPQNPVNPYGASKAMVERMLCDCERLTGFVQLLSDISMQAGRIRRVTSASCVTRRPTSFRGPIQGYISNFAVFGNDYPTPDGTAIRDYVHVSDLAEAHVAALQHLLAGKAGGAFNLGTGRGYSVKQVLDAIAAETGESLPVLKASRREGDPPVLVADASLSHTELGFAPRLSDLKTIVGTASYHRRAHPRLVDTRSTAPSVETRNFTSLP